MNSKTILHDCHAPSLTIKELVFAFSLYKEDRLSLLSKKGSFMALGFGLYCSLEVFDYLALEKTSEYKHDLNNKQKKIEITILFGTSHILRLRRLKMRNIKYEFMK